MAHENECSALQKAAQVAHALLDEEGVTHSERLIDYQDIRVDIRDDCKGESHEHAAGIGFQRLVDKLTDVGKGHDVLVSRLNLRGRKAQYGRIHVHVLAARELWIKPRAEFKERANTTNGPNAAGRRCQRSAQDLKQ